MVGMVAAAQAAAATPGSRDSQRNHVSPMPASVITSRPVAPE
jgi:hypothetical protein